ncbi:hypothetical protein HDV01_005182 [Terramyces sp. JEL0728]|nr:hypothetical protein HDV01_005182 [Terramyces sp. JEL0728]
MSLIINWKGKKQSVHFDDEYAKYQDDWTAHITLQQLIAKLANASGVPEDRIKLLHGGDQKLEKDLDGYLHDVEITILPKIKTLQEGIGLFC